MNPLVTVVIPLYNYAQYVGGCIESALAQDYEPLEVLVLDDGSSDDSLRLARGFEPRVRVLHHENRGTAATVNRGIEEARGDYVAWLSADDLFLPHKIRVQMERFSSDPGLACVYSQMRWRADAEAALAFCPLPREEARKKLQADGQVEWDTAYEACPDDEVLGRLLQTKILIYLGTSLIPKRIFEKHGLLDTAYRRSHDYEYVMRLAAAGERFAMVEDALVVGRAHAGNVPAWAEIREDENRVRRLYLQRCALKQFYPRLSDAALTEHVRWLLHHGMLDEARAAYDDRVRDGAPNAWSRELAKAWMGAGDAARALPECDKWLAVEPASMTAHYLRGDALRACGQLWPALRSYAGGVRRAVAPRKT